MLIVKEWRALVSCKLIINGGWYYTFAGRKMTSFTSSQYKIDKYRCVKVDLDQVLLSNPNLLQEPHVLLQLLKESQKEWDEIGVRAIWFTIKNYQCKLVPVLIQNGFDYHHAKPGLVTLCKRIKTDEPNNIPCYPYTNIGVGGLVINKKDEILVVKEKYHFGLPLWKFPGGYAMKGEDLKQTAEREILEETGIRTKFEYMIALRHSHKFQFDCSDMYFVAHLCPVDEEDLTPVRGLHEIADVCWMHCKKLEPQLSPFNGFILSQFLKLRKSDLQMRSKKMDSLTGLVDVYYVGPFDQTDKAKN